MPVERPTPEQAQILSRKPLAQMRFIAAALNWRGLRLHSVLFASDELQRRSDIPPNGIITYYMTTDFKFCLDIRELEDETPFTHRMTVRADRYGIKNTGWHPFTLHSKIDDNLQEIKRLQPTCDRRLFKDLGWVRQFKLANPDLLLPTRKRRGVHC